MYRFYFKRRLIRRLNLVIVARSDTSRLVDNLFQVTASSSNSHRIALKQENQTGRQFWKGCCKMPNSNSKRLSRKNYCRFWKFSRINL